MSDLQKQIDELKEEQQAFIEVCQMPCKDCKLNIIKEVLRGINDKLHDKNIIDIGDYISNKEKLDTPKTEKKDLCSLKEQNDCDEFGSLDCISGNSEGIKALRKLCLHGKKELEKDSKKEAEEKAK